MFGFHSIGPKHLVRLQLQFGVCFPSFVFPLAEASSVQWAEEVQRLPLLYPCFLRGTRQSTDNYTCGVNGFACIDPDAECVDDDDVTVGMIENCGWLGSIGRARAASLHSSPWLKPIKRVSVNSRDMCSSARARSNRPLPTSAGYAQANLVSFVRDGDSTLSNRCACGLFATSFSPSRT